MNDSDRQPPTAPTGMAQTELEQSRNRRLVVAAGILEQRGKPFIAADIRAVVAENDAQAARLSTVEDAVRDALWALENVLQDRGRGVALERLREVAPGAVDAGETT